MTSMTVLAPHSASEHRSFYLAMGLVCALITVVGFAPHYFFMRSAERPPLTPLLHIHAGTFTAWIALFTVQAGLIRADRREWHRRLGLFAALLAIVMLLAGTMTALESASTGRAPRGLTPATHLLNGLAQFLVAGCFLAIGFALRRHREAHKRLMLLATIGMLGPAINRIVVRNDIDLIVMSKPTVTLAIMLALVAAGMIYDYVKHRRVHPVYVYGALTFILTRPLRAVIAESGGWQRFASWLAS